MTPLDLVSGVHKGYVHGGYLPLLMVRSTISVNKYLTVAQSYLGLTSVVDLDMVLLEIYLCSWSSDNQNGTLNCEEKIAFYGSPESWTVFLIELTGIIIQRGLFQLFIPTYSGGGGKTPLRQHFQSVWLWIVLNMAVNNLLLMWTIHEVNMDGIRLWY